MCPVRIWIKWTQICSRGRMLQSSYVTVYDCAHSQNSTDSTVPNCPSDWLYFNYVFCVSPGRVFLHFLHAPFLLCSLIFPLFLSPSLSLSLPFPILPGPSWIFPTMVTDMEMDVESHLEAEWMAGPLTVQTSWMDPSQGPRSQSYSIPSCCACTSFPNSLWMVDCGLGWKRSKAAGWTFLHLTVHPSLKHISG